MKIAGVRLSVPIIMVGAAVAVGGMGIVLATRATARTDLVALADLPKGVTVVEARAAHYRPFRRYVGTVEPWIEAHVGPQLISAYADTVLVRPGDAVKRGQVLATLDCRNASASSKAVSMQARAIQAEQEAVAHEAARVAELKEGGFASANEIEKRAAESASKQAELMETQAKLQRATLEVNDCVLRAPFAGEIAGRFVDPGGFVRPGTAVVTLVDRSNVRVTAEVPEADFAAVAPGTAARITALATGRTVQASVTRRSPAADPATRTVHLELDLQDLDRALPVGTTAEIVVDLGEPAEATEVPLTAAAIRGEKASLFVVAQGTAHKALHRVLGERDGSVFLERSLRPGVQVVTEGRALLRDGDRVDAKAEPAVPRDGSAALGGVVGGAL